MSLSTAILLGSAGTSAPRTAFSPRGLDDGIITRVLEFFGIELQSRVSIGPG